MFETSKSGDRFAESELRFGTLLDNVIAEPKPYGTSAIISLDDNHTFQKIIGFGGALTDSAALTLADLPKHLQVNAISDYHSESGIGYNLIRIPMAGTDFSTRAYSYDDVDGDFELDHFALTTEDLDYKVCSYHSNSITLSALFIFRFHI